MGSGLVFLSFFVPLVLNVSNFHVLDSLYSALLSREKTDLMLAAIRLVMLNSVRSIPHYLGAFFIGISLEVRRQGKPIWMINAIFMMLILFATYQGIELVHDIRYDFGIPAVAVSCVVLLIGRMDYQHISLPKKSIQVILFLIAFQFLDIMPVMNGMPVGRGETSTDIKVAAYILDGEMLLNIVGIAGCLILLLFGFLIVFQLREENSLRRLSLLQEQNAVIRTNARLNEMQNRTYQEMQYLVHDLKSPLTAMQTLVGLLKMDGQQHNSEKNVEYLTRVENGITQMSSMISEILYEEQYSQITTQEILNMALAQISVTEYAAYVTHTNNAEGACVAINRFLFPRALINLIENAYNARSPKNTPVINLDISHMLHEDIPMVLFQVSDNGVGIPPDMMTDIWERTVSGTESSGLGLAFVKTVVEKEGGEITLESNVPQGTVIKIMLPEEGVSP